MLRATAWFPTAWSARDLLLAGTGLRYALEQILRWRKHAAFAQGLPPAFQGRVSDQKYRETVAYNARKNKFGAVQDAVELAALAAQVFVLWPWLWDVALAWTGTAAAAADASSWQTAGTFMVLDLLVGSAVSEPCALYYTFVVDAKFNKHTARTYCEDKLKGVAVNLVISGIMFFGLVGIVDWAGKGAWFFLWAFLSAFVFLLQIVYPIWIAPRFNTFTPLEDGALKDSIDELVAASGFHCRKCFMVDGSRQSAHSNAYVAGMCGTKRIVIYDTLLADLSNDHQRVKAVVGHEIGHSVLNHNWILLAATLVNFFCLFFTFGFVEARGAETVAAFGFRGPATTFLQIHCFMAVYSTTVMPFFSVLLNAIVRQLEFQADRYSVQLGFDIRASLFDLSKKNLGDLNPDPWHSAWHHTHPPLLERLDAVSALLGPMPEPKEPKAPQSANKKDD